jgi:hypothetical protein
VSTKPGQLHTGGARPIEAGLICTTAHLLTAPPRRRITGRPLHSDGHRLAARRFVAADRRHRNPNNT